MRTLAVLAAAAALVLAAPAAAETYCVGVERPDCVEHDTLADAMVAAATVPGADRIHVGPGTHPGPFADTAGSAVDIRGAGPMQTTLTSGGGTEPTLSLTQGESRISGAALEGTPGQDAVLALTGARARTIRLAVPAGAAGVLATGPASTADGVLVTLGGTGAIAFSADCGYLVVRQATVTGTGTAGAHGVCASEQGGALVAISDSVLHGTFDPTDGAVTAVTSWFDETVPGEGNLTGTDPGFVAAGDPRLRPSSPLIDRGRAVPLASDEPDEDLGGWVRVVDGDGDGAVRRDIGAYELQPVPLPLPEGNVLANPMAELAATDGGAPPGWARTGAITTVPYGSVDADAPFPTVRAAEALGGGGAFFAGGAGPTSTLTQRIDLTGSAAQIDTGQASAALSGLLGGYRLDEDRATVDATFLDPDARPISGLRIGPVTAADRANATNLLFRSASGAIPVGTRAIDVVVTAERVGAAEEVYTDAYADNLALVLSVPGAPTTQPIVPGEPIVPDLKPFAGVTVLTPKPVLRRDGTLRARLACASATVGRCTGTIVLRGTLPRRTTVSKLAARSFSIAPGGRVTSVLRIAPAARRALRGTSSFRARFDVAAADGQGRRRATTVPVRVRRG